MDTLRNYLYSVLESDKSLNAVTNSLDTHYHLFYELSATPSSIFEEIESILNEYQPSSSTSSYYIDYENRLRIFLFLSHLINNPISFKQNGYKSNNLNDHQLEHIDAQCSKLCDIIAPKLHSLIFELVFPCKSGLNSSNILSPNNNKKI